MRDLKALALGLFLTLASFTGAFAQCGTQAPANKFCGNDTGSAALATYKSIPAGALTPIAGGTVLGNPTGALAVPVATTAPVLGIPGTSTGQVGLAGSGSGTAILRAQTAAGSGVSLLPTAGGTLVGTVTAPLTLDAVTGLLSLPGQSGGVLAGSSPAFTRTPVLGVPGSFQGTLGFAGLTSGTATITAQATAGSPTLTLPNTSGTFAVGASSPLVLSATTGALTCPTCVTSSGGGAITGTAPISVSAAGVVSITSPLPLTNGGTNASLTASNGGIFYSTASAGAILSGTATARQMLQSGASTTPAWSTTTWPATATINRLLYVSAANVITDLATANGGLLNTDGSGVPSVTPTPTLGVNGGTGGQITLNGSTSGSGVLKVAAAAGSGIVFQFPSSNGSSTNVLSTNGAGVTSWVAAGSGTVTSITCNNGLDGGAITTTGTCSLSSARRTAQTVSKCLSAGTGCSNGGFGGAGTYTTPANVISLDITIVGAGGGGEGSGSAHGNGTAATDTCWNTTGAACTTPVYNTQGGAGGNATTGGAGGVVTGSGTCDFSIPGTRGGSSNGALTVSAGSPGGGNPFGGGGAGGAPGAGGSAGTANTGGGGGGASSNGTAGPGSGGGGGAWCKVHITSPAATYTYVGGTVGASGTAGVGGTAGGTGATPGIWVQENYNIN